MRCECFLLRSASTSAAAEEGKKLMITERLLLLLTLMLFRGNSSEKVTSLSRVAPSSFWLLLREIKACNRQITKQGAIAGVCRLQRLFSSTFRTSVQALLNVGLATALLGEAKGVGVPKEQQRQKRHQNSNQLVKMFLMMMMTIQIQKLTNGEDEDKGDKKRRRAVVKAENLKEKTHSSREPNFVKRRRQ